MTKSPGHESWPHHKIIESHPKIRLEVFYNDRKIADSDNVVKVVEDNHPDRYYIPREHVDMNVLERTEKTTGSPFKGIAHYYTIKVGSKTEEGAVWTYEEPYAEHKAIKGRMCFDESRMDAIRITSIGLGAA